MTAESRLNELLRALYSHRSDRDEAERRGDADWLERCDLAIRTDYVLIRRHCEEHGLDVPMDVPES